MVFFTGMFITIDGFNSTGIPGTIWDIMEPHARIHDTSGIIILTLVVILLSNVASNVPTGKSIKNLVCISFVARDAIKFGLRLALCFQGSQWHEMFRKMTFILGENLYFGEQV